MSLRRPPLSPRQARARWNAGPPPTTGGVAADRSASTPQPRMVTAVRDAEALGIGRVGRGRRRKGPPSGRVRRRRKILPPTGGSALDRSVRRDNDTRTRGRMRMRMRKRLVLSARVGVGEFVMRGILDFRTWVSAACCPQGPRRENRTTRNAVILRQPASADTTTLNTATPLILPRRSRSPQSRPSQAGRDRIQQARFERRYNVD